MVNAVGYFPYTMTPMNNITAPSYRDGLTYTRQLEQLKDWLNTVVIDGVNNQYADAIAQFQAGIANAEQAYLDFINNSVTELAGLNDASIAALTDNPASATSIALNEFIAAAAVLPGQLDALTAAGVLDVDSDVRAALDGRYATSTALSDAAAALLPATARGAANGVASLDAAGKVPAGQVPAPTDAGTLVARPAAAGLVDGALYYATDTGETYRNDNGAWALVGKGGFLGSAKLATTFETSAIELTDVPGLAVTFVAGSGPVKITFSGEANSTVTNGRVVGAVYVGTSDIGHINVTVETADVGRDFTRVYLPSGLIPGEIYTARVRIMAHYLTGGFAKLSGVPENQTLLMVEAA